ncbi:hypothetical protein CYMTET_38698 [Cymbomonas tetramitiformis]|uniref:Uncharacterized protein n=1 Tax=Cymbomonas tetramitiformis TaxID=36881 RepID=A0AAE0CCX6_9CHLO|nr:hypothetical protein CYMTET_38698 [Cymbomonas tetramitiformis]
MEASYGLTQLPLSAGTLQFGFTLAAFWGIYGFLPESLIFVLYFVVTPYLPPGLEPVSSWPFIQDHQMIMFNTAHIILILALIQYFIYRGSPIKFISVTEYPGNLLGFLTLSLALRFVFRMSYLFILDRWDGNGCHSLVCCSEEKTVSVNDPAAVAQASELWLFFVWRTIGEVAKGAIMVSATLSYVNANLVTPKRLFL